SGTLLRGEPIDLYGHNERVGVCLHPDKTAIRCSTETLYEVLEVVELLYLPKFVLIVEVSHKPVLRILQDVPGDRAGLLGRVDLTDRPPSALLRDSIVDLA